MEFYEREFLVSRIVAGYLLYKVNDNLTLRINPMTKDQNYRAQLEFKAAYDEALVERIMCPIGTKEMLEEHKIWTEEEKKELKEIQKEIEDLKVDVYQSYFKSVGREIARQLLKKKRARQEELFALEHSYDFANTVGIATFARWTWIIENTTTYEDGTPYDWKDVTVQDVLAYWKQNMLSEGKLREIASSEPWRGIWSAGKKEGSIFGRCSSELTVEQRILIGWSMMYDSIGDSPEAPPDRIVEDNDALDGWLLVQSRKRKQAKEKSMAEELMGKHPEAKDVFIKADSDEDKHMIEGLNDLNGYIKIF